MTTRLLAMLLLAPAAALANPYRSHLTDSAESLEDALSAARRLGGGCHAAVRDNLFAAINDVDSIRLGTTQARFNQVESFLSGLHSASRTSCPHKVSERIGRAIDSLGRARAKHNPEEARRELRQRRHDHDDDDGPPPANARVEAQMGVPRITWNQLYEGEPSVRVDVPSVALKGLNRSTYYVAARVRSQGPWSEWVASPQFPVTRDPFLANDVHTFWFPMRKLANGRFALKVSLFDANRQELTSQEVQLEPVAAVPPPPPVARDCGTGPDAGCAMMRHGQFAMDRAVFTGFYASLQAANSDITRADMSKTVFGRSWVTAKQLGMVLELFNSDNTRFDVARVAAPHTVNPQHALGLSAKFRSSLLQRDFIRLMTDQR